MNVDLSIELTLAPRDDHNLVSVELSAPERPPAQAADDSSAVPTLPRPDAHALEDPSKVAQFQNNLSAYDGYQYNRSIDENVVAFNEHVHECMQIFVCRDRRPKQRRISQQT